MNLYSISWHLLYIFVFFCSGHKSICYSNILLPAHQYHILVCNHIDLLISNTRSYIATDIRRGRGDCHDMYVGMAITHRWRWPWPALWWSWARSGKNCHPCSYNCQNWSPREMRLLSPGLGGYP